MNWIFEGIGTALLILIIGGGAYAVRRKRHIQKQKGGKNTGDMYQAGRDINHYE